MKAIKPILAVLLALSFMLAFVACGGGDDENKTETTAAVTKAATEEASTEADADSTTKADTAATTAKATSATKKTSSSSSDDDEVSALIPRTTNSKGKASDSFVKSLKGFNLKIFDAWQPNTKSSNSTIKNAYVNSAKDVENAYGVTISEDGVFTNYNESLQADLAAKNAKNHVYMVQNTYFASWFKTGYLADLTSAMSESGVTFQEPWYNQSASAFFNIQGKQVAWISYDAEYTFPYCIVYNRTHIKSAGLTDPQTLAQQGKWTWDKLIEYSKKLNGRNGNVGFGTIDKTMMVETMAQQKGTSFVNIKRGASPTTNISNQTVKDCLSTLYTWCKDDKLCNTFSGQDWTYAKTQFAVKGKVSMIFGFHDTIKLLVESKTTDEFAVVQFPMPTGTKSYTNVSIPQFAIFIPSQHQSDAAKILFLRNEVYRYNYRYATKTFNAAWKTYFSNKETLTYCNNMKYEKNGNSTVFSWLTVCEKNDDDTKTHTSTIINEVLKQSSNNVQSVISSKKTSLEKAYKDMWEGFKITGKI